MKQKNNKESMTRKDIEQLVDATTNPMTKAFIDLMYESGCRVGELITMRLNDILPLDKGVCLHIITNTSSRVITIPDCNKNIIKWLKMHPFKDDSNQYVWINKHGKVIRYADINRLLTRYNSESGITKITPHDIRYIRVKELSAHFTEDEMCKYFGWHKKTNNYINSF